MRATGQRVVERGFACVGETDEAEIAIARTRLPTPATVRRVERPRLLACLGAAGHCRRRRTQPIRLSTDAENAFEIGVGLGGALHLHLSPDPRLSADRRAAASAVDRPARRPNRDRRQHRVDPAFPPQPPPMEVADDVIIVGIIALLVVLVVLDAIDIVG